MTKEEMMIRRLTTDGNSMYLLLLNIKNADTKEFEELRKIAMEIWVTTTAKSSELIKNAQ